MSHLSSCLPFQVLLLGHALKIKAEREYFLYQTSKSSHEFHNYFPSPAYLKSSSTGGWDSSSDWLIVSVCLSVFLALLLLWVLFYKLYWVSLPKLLFLAKYFS